MADQEEPWETVARKHKVVIERIGYAKTILVVCGVNFAVFFVLSMIALSQGTRVGPDEGGPVLVSKGSYYLVSPTTYLIITTHERITFASLPFVLIAVVYLGIYDSDRPETPYQRWLRQLLRRPEKPPRSRGGTL